MPSIKEIMSRLEGLKVAIDETIAFISEDYEMEEDYEDEDEDIEATELEGESSKDKAGKLAMLLKSKKKGQGRK